MLHDHDLRGVDLPRRTLCLTYDDGPGPQTAELGDYLAGRGIAATFFLIGERARAQPEVVAQLRAAGHLVGNHTDTHPTLVSFLRDGGDVVAELARADAAIGADGATFFRPPYGYWRDDAPGGDPAVSPVAAALNASGRFPHLVGPVGWDVDARDWQFWREGGSAEACGRAYLAAIEAAGGGIVLMHDGGETPALRDGNRALELARWLVPRLEDRGYRFARLDAVLPTGPGFTGRDSPRE